MTRHVKIKVNLGGKLVPQIVPKWLAKIITSREIDPAKMPTFCGAGDGWGDRTVPDFIRRICISLACAIHDLDWAASPDSIREFIVSNLSFGMNCRYLILASDRPWWVKELAIVRAWGLYFTAVTTAGAICFNPLGDTFLNPLDNPEVQNKLKRLAAAMKEPSE